jgi:hypothetical protein
MRVIFLDIDGVLNNTQTVTPVDAPWRGPGSVEPGAPEWTLLVPIDPVCMARLNRLVAETGAKIVMSSSWRLFARWQDLGPALARYGLVGDVIGETPDLVNNGEWLNRWRTRDGAPFQYERMQRGWEIREWLAAHPEVTEFVILDDCSDMDELKPWLTLTHPVDGLDDPDVERAKFLMAESARALPIVRKLAIGYGPAPRSGEGEG